MLATQENVLHCKLYKLYFVAPGLGVGGRRNMSQKMIALYTVDFSFLLKYQMIIVLTNDKVVFISGLNHGLSPCVCVCVWVCVCVCVCGGGGGVKHLTNRRQSRIDQMCQVDRTRH